MNLHIPRGDRSNGICAYNLQDLDSIFKFVFSDGTKKADFLIGDFNLTSEDILQYFQVSPYYEDFVLEFYNRRDRRDCEPIDHIIFIRSRTG